VSFFTPAGDPLLFHCPCQHPDCDAPSPSPRLLDLLERTRARLGEPIVVTSGVRCVRHNAEVGGEPDSEHVTGEGCDLRVTDGVHRRQLVRALEAEGCDRIGFYATDAHIHADVATAKAPAYWVRA
jgi:uncharacterized protein YcbK (DUF882 family)